MPKIAVFVDVQNIYYTVRQGCGSHFNYGVFWQEIAARGEILSAVAYAVDRCDPQQEKFQQILRDIGFTVKLKPYIQRADGSSKGDWDVGITIDMLEAAATADTLVLASGDGDFGILLHHLSNRYQLPTWVYGVPSLTAASLVKAAAEYHEISGKLLLPIR